jgi:hypothetical protein
MTWLIVLVLVFSHLIALLLGVAFGSLSGALAERRKIDDATRLAAEKVQEAATRFSTAVAAWDVVRATEGRKPS